MTEQQHTAPGAPRGRRVLRAAGSAALWALLVVAGVLLWPTNLGGCTSLTVVSGHSMEPTYYTGDLVLARCGTPRVGDVVVYEPQGYDGARIIHRVTGGDGSGWVLQGDNNPEVDPFAPTDDDVVGIARVHVPAVGRLGLVATNPWTWASLVVVGLGLLLWPSRDEDEDEQGAREDERADDAPHQGAPDGDATADDAPHGRRAAAPALAPALPAAPPDPAGAARSAP